MIMFLLQMNLLMLQLMPPLINFGPHDAAYLHHANIAGVDNNFCQQPIYNMHSNFNEVPANQDKIVEPDDKESAPEPEDKE